MKKKLMSILLCTAVTASLLGGCGNTAADPSSAPETGKASGGSQSTADSKAAAPGLDADNVESRPIKILSMWPEDDQDSTANGCLIVKMCEDYRDKVDPEFSWEFEYVDSDNLKTKVQTLAASGDLPDIFAYDAGTPLIELIDAGLVQNMTTALTELGVYDKLDAGATEYLANLTGTGDIYDLPLGLNIEGFWYNKELFAQAGIETAPTTWEEMLKDADQLLAAGIQPFSTGAGDSWPATRLLHAYAVREMGADCMEQAAAGELAYNSEGFVHAAQMIQDMTAKGYFGEGATTVDQNTAADMVMNGKAAMIYNGSWYASTLNAATNPAGEDGIGFFSVPTVAGGKGTLTEYPMNCGTILCVSAASYDKTLSSFLGYFVSNVGDYAMSEFGALKGYQVADSISESMPAYTRLVADEMQKVTGTANWFEALMSSELSTVVQENIQSLMNGDMTAEEYCNTMQEISEIQQ